MRVTTIVNPVVLGISGLFTLAMSGCSQPSPPVTPPPQKPAPITNTVAPGGNSSPGSSTNSAANPAEITIQTVDKAGYDDVIRKHQGQVVLADFWATWCIPCKKMFPHTVHLHNEFAGTGLAVVSVCLDDEAEEPAALEFLKKQNATFDNLRVKSGGEDETFEKFEIASGAIPHLKLYDRTGKIHRVFDADPTADKQFTADDVEQAVRELLK